MENKKSLQIKTNQNQKADSKSEDKLKIKNLNDNKQIGLLLISLINETSKQSKDFEIILKEKEFFLHQKKNYKPNNPNENIKFDYATENSKRLAILENFNKIENILEDNYLIPRKVLESILVLLLKTLSNIINTLDIKRIIKCVSSILRKQILIFSSLNKLSELYEILISKKIIENIIKNYLVILENSKVNKSQIEIKDQDSNFTNNNEDMNKLNLLEKEVIDEIFSSWNFLYFPMKDSFKLSVMPGVISKIGKFYLKNNEIGVNVKNYNNNKIKDKNTMKFLLSKKTIFTIYKLFNHNLALLIYTESPEDFLKNFPNFFETFNLFFNDLCRMIIDVNHKANLFSSIDLDIKLKSVLKNENGSDIKFDSETKQKVETININISTFLEEINYTSFLICKLFLKLNNNVNLHKSKDIIKINYEDIFTKISLINQRYLFENLSKSKLNDDNEEITIVHKKGFITIINSYNNFKEMFSYEILMNYLNNDLKTLNVILNKQETHKINNLFFQVNGIIQLYKLKYKKEFLAKNNNNDSEKIKANLVSIAWKFIECLIDKFFILRNIKFLEFQEFSNYDLKNGNISNELCLENIFKILIQFFNGTNNNLNFNNFASSYSLTQKDEYNTFLNALVLIKLVYCDDLLNENKNDSAFEANKKQDLNFLNINNLIKCILTKNLHLIKNLKTTISKIGSLNEQIEFLRENLNEYIESDFDEQFNSDEPNENNLENECYNDLINCQMKLKNKYLLAVASLKENFKALLKNLVVALLILLEKKYFAGNKIDYALVKNFVQQINYIYSNFLILSESENDSANLFFILNHNEDQIISNVFPDLKSNAINIENSNQTSDSNNLRKSKNEKFNLNILHNELLKSVIILSYYTLIKYQIEIKNPKEQLFSQLELKQILMFTLINYSSNHSQLLKFSSIILIRNLNALNEIQKKANLADIHSETINEINNESNYNFRNFVLSNFDFLLNSIIKKLIFNNRNEDEKYEIKEISKEKKLNITNLFYSLILLILEIEDNEIRNFYSLELNKFMNKFFFYLDEDIKNKDLFNLECSLEIMKRITEFQEKILKENYLKFLSENNKLYENQDLNIEKLLKEETAGEEANQQNIFSEFLKSNGNFSNANTHRKLILRLCPLFLSNNNFLIHKFLNIYSNSLLVLFMLPLDREENANFSAEDPANVQIKNSLGPLLYETWNYFLYVIKSIKNIKTLDQVTLFIARVVKIYPNFINESRIFKEFIPAFSQCLGECLFKNYEVSITTNSVFSVLFNLQMLFYFNLKNSLNEEKLWLLISLDNSNANKRISISDIKFYVKSESYEMFKELFVKIKKFYGSKLDNCKIKSLKSFINLSEKSRKLKNNFEIDCIRKDKDYKLIDLTNDNSFFDFVEKESKNVFNFESKYYDIQNISHYYNLETELVDFINESNFDFYSYLDFLESSLKIN